MRAIRCIATTCIAAALLALRAGSGVAQPVTDWIDEMPTVASVVQAARERLEVKQRANPGLVGDADELADHIAGTFVLLRWVMQVALEEEGLWPTSALRRSKLDDISLAYQQAELAMGLGAGRRSGYVVKICTRPGSWVRAQWPLLEECYQRAFHTGLGAISRERAHRRAVFARLFCDRADFYLALMDRRPPEATLPTPALTRRMPDGAPNVGTAFCRAYGGDANGNGLCDAWERPLAAGRASASGASTCARPQARAQLVIHKLTQIDAQTVRADFSRGEGTETAPTLFELRRTNGARTVVKAIARPSLVVFGRSPDGATEAVTLRSQAAALAPDRATPWLEVFSTAGTVTTGARCRQVGPLPLTSDVVEDRIGFFGPFRTADEAAVAAVELARILTLDKRFWLVGGREVGMKILVHSRGAHLPVGQRGPYLLTSFIYGNFAVLYHDPPTVSYEQYTVGETAAAGISCSPPFDGSTYYVAGLAHSHPWDVPAPNSWNPFEWPADGVTLSKGDRDQYAQLRGLWPTFEKSYLFGTDNCVYALSGAPGSAQVRIGCAAR